LNKKIKVFYTDLHTGHFASRGAILRPWKIITEAEEQAHPLQKRCPQLKAYGLNTVSCINIYNYRNKIFHRPPQFSPKQYIYQFLPKE